MNMQGDARARKRAHGVLTEFVEAAEPRRQKKMKRNWWWQPSQFAYRRIEYWPTNPDHYAERSQEKTQPDPVQVVVLPPYGARINAPGGDAE
jgi:hypothetical protein